MTLTWNDEFLALFDRCVAAYKANNFDWESDYTEDELNFLGSIGYKPRELFDFVEDFVDDGSPSRSTALLVAAARRDYFLIMQEGIASQEEITKNDLPTFGDELEGIYYLPRIIKKAEAKLRGELDPDIMYGCGGDRKFLTQNGDIPMADFLRHVWAADGDHSRISDYVRSMQSA